MSPRETEVRFRHWRWAALFVIVAMEFVLFRQIAGFVSWAIGRGWGPGSSIEYFRAAFVMPALLVFFAAAVMVAAVAWKRDPHASRRLFLTMCVVDVALMFGLLGWYFATVVRAGASTSR